MLYLFPPFHIINQITVFRDHEDVFQWYYLPGPPRLTEVRDNETGVLLPQIQLIEFRGSAGNGGFLNFDVNLGVDADELENIRDEIKLLENLDGTPRLAPVPLTDGTVKMMLFDSQTGDLIPGEANTELKFVLKLSHHAKPALYGDNQTAFSAQLSEAGVTAVKKSLQGEMLPIGIIYSLDYLALRPAYSVKLHIDWERVQKHFEKSFGSDSIFFQAQINKEIDVLIENRTIELKTDLFVPEGEDKDLMLKYEQAVDEVRDMITNAFFEPSLNPEPEKADTWDKIEHLLKTSSALAVTGGWGALIGFSYRNIDYRRIDQKRLNVNIQERTTVKKSVFPQGHLKGLFQVLREPGINMKRFVTSIDLSDPWFAQRKINVVSRANFSEDNITSIKVHLDYGGEPENIILDESTKNAAVKWSSILEEGVMRREVRVRYTVHFKNTDGTERPIKIQSPEMNEIGDIVEINPRDLYSIVSVPIQALSFPWDFYSHVEVQLQYMDQDHEIRQTDSFLLQKEDKTEMIWKMFVLNKEKTQFRYKLIYRAIDYRDVEMPWKETDQERLIIRDPFSVKRTLEIVPVIDWSKVYRAFVDVSYKDTNHGVFKENSFEFNSSSSETKKFIVSLEDPDKRVIGYKVTIINQDGTITELPESFTLERRVIVREDMKGHKIVSIRPEMKDFALHKIREVVIRIHYEDLEHGLSFADEFTMKSSSDKAHFEYDFAVDSETKYRYQIIRRYTNGLRKVIDWQTSDMADLIVPLV